jgi:NAD+ diphosphatase
MMDNFQKSLQNTFVAQAMERVHNRRKDKDWIIRQMSDSRTCFVPIRQSRVFISEGEVPAPVLLSWNQLEGLVPEDSIFFLGEQGRRAYFVVDLDEEAPCPFEHMGRFRDLRAVAPLLSRDDGALLAYAKTLAHWHRNNRFCGACGGRNESRDGGHLRACVNPRCGALHFPRTDPAMIVLVRYGGKCLLGRQQVWPGRMYSVLAGFVEPGESAEGAVAREVLEEVGVRVKEIRYHSSQPWPFPSSLMLGFTAEAVDDRISLGDEELEDARWFERNELREAVESGILNLPTPVSISFRLIEEWFDSESPYRLREFASRGFVVSKRE